jgi:hypothetical protein
VSILKVEKGANGYQFQCCCETAQFRLLGSEHGPNKFGEFQKHRNHKAATNGPVKKPAPSQQELQLGDQEGPKGF